MNIKGSTWFTNLKGDCIGIVIVGAGFDDKEYEKAYIGTGTGADQRQDEIDIAHEGAPFPLHLARQLI